MSTPTPGELSARLQALSDACLSRRLTPAECGEFHDCIAALSALPAAGGEESSRTLFGCAYQLAGYHDAPEVWLDRLSDAMQGRPLPDSDTLIAQLLPYAPDTPEKWDGHTHVASEDDGDTCEVCGRNFRAHATAPQPSAAEEGGYDSPAQERLARRVLEKHEGTLRNLADAAVGAQGDGCDHCGRHVFVVHGSDAHCNYCGRVTDRYKSAAPAAGKGVDGVSLADIHLAAQMLTWGRDEGLTEKQEAEVDAHAQKLFAALTRQPVAGDGDDAANWRRAKACMSAIGQSDKSVSYACALLLSENARKVNAGRAEITLRGITDGDEECGDWRITVEQLAAPAATPTDGGEG